MKQVTQKELAKILEKHQLWIKGEKGGERANLIEANLRGANLRRADLRRADLIGANLIEANLIEANLIGANLIGANLIGANLRRANLRGANLIEADLIGANLIEADLIGANLIEADLIEANLENTKGVPPIVCPEKGSFTAFKTVCDDYIVELYIPSSARRCSATSRKCRCDRAKVISITTIDGKKADVTEVASKYDANFIYRVGEYVEVKDFCEDRWKECAPGIHFFITRQEAVEY